MPAAVQSDITMQQTEDPNTLVYHTKFEMTDVNQSAVRGNSFDLCEFGELVLSIRGVAKISVYPYLLAVTRAPMFNWDEIRPKIENLLKHFVISQRQLEDALKPDVAPLAPAKRSARARISREA